MATGRGGGTRTRGPLTQGLPRALLGVEECRQVLPSEGRGGVDWRREHTLQCHICARAPGSNQPRTAWRSGSPWVPLLTEHKNRMSPGPEGAAERVRLLPWCQGDARRPPHTCRAHAGARGKHTAEEGCASTVRPGLGSRCLTLQSHGACWDRLRPQVTRGEPRL